MKATHCTGPLFQWFTGTHHQEFLSLSGGQTSSFWSQSQFFVIQTHCDIPNNRNMLKTASTTFSRVPDNFENDNAVPREPVDLILRSEGKKYLAEVTFCIFVSLKLSEIYYTHTTLTILN